MKFNNFRYVITTSRKPFTCCKCHQLLNGKEGYLEIIFESRKNWTDYERKRFCDKCTNEIISKCLEKKKHKNKIYKNLLKKRMIKEI